MKVTVTFAMLVLLAACSRAPAGAPPGTEKPAVRVIVQPLRFEPQHTHVEAVGTSRAKHSVDIYPATSGEVVAINFEPGQFATKGQALVELDRRSEELAVRLAELMLENAERLYDRYQRSANSGAVVQTVLDEAATAAKSARLELERAEIALSDRTVRAAFDGYVGGTEVDRGDRINTGTMITTLDDRSSLFVSFEVPEAFIGTLSVGEEAMLETWNSGSPVVYGEIVDIGSRIDPQTRNFTARIRVPNQSDSLRPGMSFRVAAGIEGQRYPVVAETGLLWGSDGAYVWAIEDGRATRVPVEVVQRREGYILISGDLNYGDILVVEGIQRMQEGIAVSYEPLRVAGQDSPQVAIELLQRENPPGSD
jgi:RND family efflux transporter MFP subunit